MCPINLARNVQPYTPVVPMASTAVSYTAGGSSNLPRGFVMSDTKQTHAERVAAAEQRVKRAFDRYWQYLGCGTHSEVQRARQRLVNAQQALRKLERNAPP